MRSLKRVPTLSSLMVLVEEPQQRLAVGHALGEAPDDLVPDGGAVGLLLAPGDGLLDGCGHAVHDPGEDVLLGAEVVVQRGLGHTEPVGDLTQRRLLVPVLGEEFQGDVEDSRPGVPARCLGGHRSA
jgi:hypothetical protein